MSDTVTTTDGGLVITYHENDGNLSNASNNTNTDVTSENFPRKKMFLTSFGVEGFNRYDLNMAKIRNFLATNKRPIIPSPSLLSAVLSQYGLLKKITSCLPTIDVIHLATTSREICDFIAADSTRFGALIASGVCSGTGLTARASVFGHWDGNVENADLYCMEGQAHPCTSCGVQVCNVSVVNF